MAYTKAQEDRIRAEAPVTFEKAVALGKEFGLSTKSVISKVQHLGLEYVRKPVPEKKEAQETKAEILARITKAVDFDTAGLAGATRDALVALADFVAPATE